VGGQGKGLMPGQATYESFVVSVETALSHQLQPLIGTAKSDTSSRSVICFDAVDDSDRIAGLPCLHFFHSNCFDGMCSAGIARCPLCRRSVLTLQEDEVKLGL
jgi:hypothetical protein